MFLIKRNFIKLKAHLFITIFANKGYLKVDLRLNQDKLAGLLDKWCHVATLTLGLWLSVECKGPWGQKSVYI